MSEEIPTGLVVRDDLFDEKCEKRKPCVLVDSESKEYPCMYHSKEGIDKGNWHHLDHLCNGRVCEDEGNMPKSGIKSLARRTQHYGYVYDYKKANSLDETVPLSDNPVVAEFADIFSPNFDSKLPTQCIVNEYRADPRKTGQGISAHTDSRVFGPIIMTLSLCGKAEMVFSREDYEPYTVKLKPGTCVLLSSDSRYKWKHMIKNLKRSDVDHEDPRRISLTYRTVKE